MDEKMLKEFMDLQDDFKTFKRQTKTDVEKLQEEVKELNRKLTEVSASGA